MPFWPALVVIAIILHLSDIRFGFGYLLSAMAVIIFGIAIALALGMPISEQEPYLAVIAPMVLIGPVLRTAYLNRANHRGHHQAPSTSSTRDRNALWGLKQMTTLGASLIVVSAHFVFISMTILLVFIANGRVSNDSESGLLLLTGGGYLGTLIATKRTESLLWHAVGLFVGLIVGGLLYTLALLFAAYKQAGLEMF